MEDFGEAEDVFAQAAGAALVSFSVISHKGEVKGISLGWEKEKIYYIQQQADELSAEISKLMRKDADLSEKHLNELIKLGVFISMTCQELLDEE